MQEYLLDGDLNSGQSRLLAEADSFDLEDFYLDKLSSGGVCLITDNQMIMTECYIKQTKGSSYAMHIDTVDAIYKAIYGKNGPEDLRDWQGKILDDGNIIIQLCSKVPTLIWIPEEISENEYELLTTFSNRINQIVASNLDYFKTNPLLFEYYVRGGAVSTTEKNIKEVLECVKVKEVKNGKSI